MLYDNKYTKVFTIFLSIFNDMLTKNSSILTAFMSLVWNHENLFAIPNNPLKSSFHRSHFLNLFFEAYFDID